MPNAYMLVVRTVSIVFLACSLAVALRIACAWPGPSTVSGTVRLPVHIMAYHGILWHIMAYPSTLWHIMALHGVTWCGMAWHCMALHGIVHGIARRCMALQAWRCTAARAAAPLESRAGGWGRRGAYWKVGGGKDRMFLKVRKSFQQRFLCLLLMCSGAELAHRVTCRSTRVSRGLFRAFTCSPVVCQMVLLLFCTSSFLCWGVCSLLSISSSRVMVSSCGPAGAAASERGARSPGAPSAPFGSLAARRG